MNKKYILTIILALAGASIAIILKKGGNTKAGTIKVGIIQTASHPALDAAKKGFIDTLGHTLGNRVEFAEYNAQGSVTNAQTIAQRLHHDPAIKAIYAIATPALQAISSLEKEKPIVIAAVTDPKSLGVVHAATNVCGVTDMIDMEAEIALLRALAPHAKTVAIIYSNAEVNSLAQIASMKQALDKHQLEAIPVGITQESDLPQALNMACRKADALLVPTDNIIASSMELVAAQAVACKKPLFACHNQAVNQGALAASGVDYYQSGKQVAQIAYDVLITGKKPYEIPVQNSKDNAIMVNKKTLTQLGLTIPKELQEKITFSE